MTGTILIGFLILALIFLIVSFFSYNGNEWRAAAVIAGIIILIFIICIPVSRIDSKQNLEYTKIFQQTLDYNRKNGQEFNVLERTSVIEEINNCNAHINKWKVKGQKWYYIKWYLHPDTQNAVLIK